MTDWTRRELLGRAGTLAAAGLLPRLPAAEAAVAGPPTVLVQFVLRGGFDALLTTDPKTRGEIAREIDLPYEEGQIARIGASRVGPLLQPLAAYVPQLAILNGVDSFTVSHPTGLHQLLQMRRVFPARAPSLLGTIGAMKAGDAPLDEVRFASPSGAGREAADGVNGRALLVDYGTKGADRNGILPRLMRLAEDQRRRSTISDVLRAEVARCGGGGNCMALEATSRLLERLPARPLPPVPQLEFLALPAGGWTAQSVGTRGRGDRETQPTSNEPSVDEYVRTCMDRWSSVMRDALFMLENELTATMLIVDPCGGWDSHTDNLFLQQRSMRITAPALRYFLGEIRHRRSVSGTRLSEQVGVVISSEFGRFPIVNRYGGKDHLPEFPVLFSGPGVRAGQYGETDRRMLATPMSFKTGRPEGGGKRAVPTIEDVAVTILKWFGIEGGASLGYLGESLDFLLT
jgi:uncharacterized protein (DUF1501 family)